MRFMLFLLPFLPLLVNAADVDYCEDLYSVACAPVKTEDPTGSAENIGRESGISESIEAHRAEYEKVFTEYISDPDNEYYLTIAKKILNHGKAPSCQFEDEESVKKCNEFLGTALFELLKHKVYSRSQVKLSFVEGLEGLNYITESSFFVKQLRSLHISLAKEYRAKESEERLEEGIFPEVKKLLVQRVNSMDIPDEQKNKMLMKIRAIRYESNGCRSGGYSIDAYFRVNAFYNPLKNSFSFCNGLLMSGQSDASMAMIAAHELAHSIDPCVIQFGVKGMVEQYSKHGISKAEKQYPASNLLRCLRSKKSVGARRDDSRLESIFIPIFGTNNPMFCDDDQINESISDWFAAEVLSKYQASKLPDLSGVEALKFFANAFKPLCSDWHQDDKKYRVHPQLQRRMNAVLLRQPEIRKTLGCKSPNKTYGYCDGQSIDPVGFSAAGSDESAGRKGRK